MTVVSHCQYASPVAFSLLGQSRYRYSRSVAPARLLHRLDWSRHCYSLLYALVMGLGRGPLGLAARSH